MENNNIRTMEFLGLDDWSRPVYKCIESNTLYKDLSANYEIPELCSCANDFDGEPCYPINSDFKIEYISKYKPNPYKFEYQLLSRLQMDCNYYLGNGNRYANHLWAGNEKDQIKKMKELYDIFPEDQKPEWLTMGQIEEYEKQMLND